MLLAFQDECSGPVRSCAVECHIPSLIGCQFFYLPAIFSGVDTSAPGLQSGSCLLCHIQSVLRRLKVLILHADTHIPWPCKYFYPVFALFLPFVVCLTFPLWRAAPMGPGSLQSKWYMTLYMPAASRTCTIWCQEMGPHQGVFERHCHIMDTIAGGICWRCGGPALKH